MTNMYYNASGNPGFLTRALSSQQRNEDLSVQGGFDKLPTPATLHGSAQNYYADTGTPNAIAITLNSNISGVYDGMELVVKVVAAPTGPATITATPTALANIVRFDNTPIQANDWVAGQFITLRYNATYGNYQYIPPFTGGATVAFPFTDSAPILKNAADGSKLLRFDLSPISASTTRVVTAPNRDVVLGISFMDRVPRTSNTQIVKANQGNIIDITSGTFTQTFAAPSALGAGFNCYVQNSGTGDITIPLSDGVTNWIMYPGEVRKFYVDETATLLKSIVIKGFYRKALSSFTYVQPPGYAYIEADLVGGAGGAGSGRKGAAASGRQGGSPGGAPGRLRSRHILAPGASISVSIGAAGTAGASQTVNDTNGNAGTAGGNTSFGSLAIAYGGVGGVGGTNNDTQAGHTSGSGSLSAGTSVWEVDTATRAGGSPTSISVTWTSSLGLTPNSTHETGGAGVSSFSLVGQSIYGGSSAASGNLSTATVGAAGNSQYGVAGGGWGGGINTANSVSNGASGGVTGSWTGTGAAGGTSGASPTAGANGAANAGTDFDMGNPGGGGGATATAGVNGAPGGNGSFPGGPGGGGGACTNGAGNSGAGGTSQPGQAIIWGIPA